MSIFLGQLQPLERLLHAALEEYVVPFENAQNELCIRLVGIGCFRKQLLA